MALALRYAARSDVGLGRYTNNQDSGYAGPHLLAVCDGMGGHAGGDVASSVAVGRLVALDGDTLGGEAVTELAQALREANQQIAARAEDEPVLAGMGTTATVLVRYDSKLALAHIGDSRGYLLRDGELTRITRDHTFVQTLVDDGRITADEAETHPQRNIVTRVLSGHRDDDPDLSVREARVGDRYLLCSDGLTGVIREETLRETLTEAADPDAAADQLLQMALRGGAPDNVTCIVADVVHPSSGTATTVPEVVGAAATHGTVTPSAPTSPAAKAAALTRPQPADDDVDDAMPVRPPASAGRWVVRALVLVAVLAVLVAGGWAAYGWSQQQYYVGADGDQVAIFKGLPQDIGPIRMSHVAERPGIALADLPEYSREQVGSSLTADDLQDARTKVGELRSQALDCAAPVPTPNASAPPSVAPTASPTTAPTPSATPTNPGCGGAG
ncbi:protein phosphatase 2C domain-containing protein [Angustibacter aerolatus]